MFKYVGNEDRSGKILSLQCIRVYIQRIELEDILRTKRHHKNNALLGCISQTMCGRSQTQKYTYCMTPLS